MNGVISIYIQSKPRPNTFMVFETRKDNCFLQGGNLPRKGFEGIFWGEGNVFYGILGGGFTSVCDCQNTEHLYVLLYVKCLSI